MNTYSELLIFYFSGTGNSKQVAGWFAEFAEKRNIVSHVYDISKIEKGKLELSRAPFSVRLLLAKIVSAFPEGSRGPGVEILSSVDSSCPDKVVGDETRIQQILMNLVSNAVKFTSVGHVKISAHAEHLATGEVLLKFGVEDTGPGIANEKLSEIFEPFFLLDCVNRSLPFIC